VQQASTIRVNGNLHIYDLILLMSGGEYMLPGIKGQLVHPECVVSFGDRHCCTNLAGINWLFWHLKNFAKDFKALAG